VGDVPVAFAFAAGLVATINPCGFAMLPAYLSYFMGLDNTGPLGRGTSVARGLCVGAVVSAGFLVVFGVSGALVNAGFRWIIDYVPWVALVIGVALAGLGVAMLVFGFQLNVALPHLERGGSSRRYGSVFLFGVSYAVASLSCALPVFLAVTGAASTTPTLLSGVLTYVVYGLGMSMLLVVLTVALAIANHGVVRRLRALLPHVGRVSGAILVASGAYITAYWVTNLRDPLAARGAAFRFVERSQTWLTDQLGSRPELWATVFGLLIAVAAAYVLWARRPDSRSRDSIPAPSSSRPLSQSPPWMSLISRAPSIGTASRALTTRVSSSDEEGVTMASEPGDRVLELVVFNLKEGVTRERFLGTVHAVSAWARTQSGFVSRDLSHVPADDRWIEVVYWRTLAEAEAAADAAQGSAACAPMFALIDMDAMLFLHGVPAVAPVFAEATT
jgi:cytochrome c-type biogenesis protein